MLLLLLSICYGHISMSYPPSRRNQLSEYYTNTGLVNYNLRSPLNVSPDFFSFPCKGFPKGPVVATFETNKITISLEGTAVHGGGHCQFGISYDDKNFVVLKTVLNNCLLDTMSYSYEIPTYAKGDNITVFWTWINRIGNREYYMECADITVNTNGKRTDISGKELLIVNLPGYPKVPEWEVNSPSSVDGRDLLAARKDINNNKIFTTETRRKTTKNIQKNNHHSSITQPINEQQIKEQATNEQQIDEQQIDKQDKCDNISGSGSENSCNSGEMRCSGTGFDTCVYDSWVYRDCSSGTTCKQNGNSIICDFI